MPFSLLLPGCGKKWAEKHLISPLPPPSADPQAAPPMNRDRKEGMGVVFIKKDKARRNMFGRCVVRFV